MNLALIVAVFPWVLLSSPTGDASDALRNVAAQRQALRSGIVDFSWVERVNGSETLRFDAEGAFGQDNRYRLSIRNHSRYRGTPTERRDPQCIQIADGGTLLGMMYSEATQRFFVDDVQDARLTLFHPLALGLFAYPQALSDPESIYFWRGAKTSLADGAHTAGGERVVRVEGEGRSGKFKADLTIDPARGWNVTGYTASVGEGYELEVRSALGKFGDFWFPARVWARTTFPGGRVVEIEVQVRKAEFAIDLPEHAFAFAALGPPADGAPKAAVLDYRTGGGGLGWWDGRRLQTAPGRSLFPQP